MKNRKTQATCCLPSRPKAAHGGAEDVRSGVAAECQAKELIIIPGGTGLLGTSSPELPLDGESPLRKTTVASFAMEATTVTNASFKCFVNETGYVTDAERIGNSFVFVDLLPLEGRPGSAMAEAPWWRMIDGASWANPLGPGSGDSCLPDHPVVHVTWNDAQTFANWAGGRLPTEKEWEHAARGGLGDVQFPWGDREPNDTDYFPCNIWQGSFPHKNLKLDGYNGIAPARSFEPNGYGLYNMVGNVWEFTSQPFMVRSLKKEIRRAHAGKTGFKLSKGGSFLCHRSYCYRYRIAARTGASADSSTSHQSFRLAFDLHQV